MYNPFPYDDPRPVNKPLIDKKTGEQLICGNAETAAVIASEIKPGQTVAIDGYVAAGFFSATDNLVQQLGMKGLKTREYDFRDCYKSEKELWELVDKNLSWDRSEDPTLLFGRLWKGGYEGLLDKKKLEEFKQELQKEDDVVRIVYGQGCLIKELRPLYSIKVFLDVNPKESILRIRRGQYINLGMKEPLPRNQAIRRCYYCDFEVAVGLRRELLASEGNVDYYVENEHPNDMKMLPYAAFADILKSLAKYPFRCKPVYLEGVWGGTYVKKLRGLPDSMRNCAWVFDLIPMEVSIVVDVCGTLLEIPFSTFFMKEGDAVLGPDVVKKFGGYFPIRFNYDDSYHSTGNMSIQCHSGSAYNREHFDEFGRQDESYYVVATGHDAKTFIGFRDDADIPQFFKDIEAADKDHKPVDYMKYVNYEESKPGLQVMLPAGTIHSSGRNQVILEIGSLTIGSYTYKMYDYLRLDFDGKQRPIHTHLGELNVRQDRRHSVIHDPSSPEYIVQQPRLAEEGEGWQEYILGENPQMYISLRRLEFEQQCQQDTKGEKFHVLTLVDGDHVRIRSVEHPERFFDLDFMEIACVPASMGKYVIENLGKEPIRVHKTCLRDGYQNDPA